MTWTPPNPTLGPDGYPWTDPPEWMLVETRKTGISDTQFVAIYRRIITDTYARLQLSEQVTWPHMGRWELRNYVRTTYPNGAVRIDSTTGLPIPQTAVTKPAIWRVSFRPRTRPEIT